MNKYACVELSIVDSIATVRLNRPEKKNCMNPELHRNMYDVMDEVEAAKCKVMVLTGNGNAFCAGMDLEKCFLEPFDDREKWAEIHKYVSDWFIKIKKSPVVTVGKVHGWCFGGGMAVAGMLDIVIASNESIWGLSEVNLGIFPGGGTTWSYANNMPRKQALYYALTADTFTGAEAVELGYATKAVPLAELDAETDRIVGMLSNKGRMVLSKIKEVYDKSLGMSLADSIEWEMAKLWELSRETSDDWIRSALTSFKKREYKPATQAYKLTKEI